MEHVDLKRQLFSYPYPYDPILWYRQFNLLNVNEFNRDIVLPTYPSSNADAMIGQGRTVS